MSDPRPDDALVVLTTAPDPETADRLASVLVSERLAACVNVVGGVTSVYRWQGAIERDAELLLVVKTTAVRLAALEARLVAEHPFEVPELVALPAAHVSGPYLAWLRGAVGPEEPGA